MKNIFKIGTLALCLVVGLSSCNDFFDAIPGEQYDLEDTFTNRSKTEQFLNNVYNYVPDETLERSARNIRIWVLHGESLHELSPTTKHSAKVPILNIFFISFLLTDYY